MKSKFNLSVNKQRIIFSAFCISLTVIVGLMIRFLIVNYYYKANGSVVLASSYNQLPISQSPENNAKLPDKTVSNNIDVTANNFTIDGKQASADVCFDLPDNADWTIWQASLKYGTDKIAEIDQFSSYPIEVREPPVNGKQRIFTFGSGQPTISIIDVDKNKVIKGKRCDSIIFAIADSESIKGISKYTITIESIAAFPREGEVCTKTNIDRFQKALDYKKSGIIIKCESEDNTSGGRSGIVIDSKPDTLSIEEAEAILNSNDLFLDVYGIRGPWIFDFVK
jgi:hypothetical protein